MGWSPSLCVSFVGGTNIISSDSKPSTPERGDDIGTPKLLASKDGKSRESNKHQQIEIKGKAAEPVCNGKHNQASVDVELSERRMYESSKSTVNRLCHGAEKGDQSTRCRSKNRKYDIVTKVETVSWFLFHYVAGYLDISLLTNLCCFSKDMAGSLGR